MNAVQCVMQQSAAQCSVSRSRLQRKQFSKALISFMCMVVLRSAAPRAHPSDGRSGGRAMGAGQAVPASPGVQAGFRTGLLQELRSGLRSGAVGHALVSSVVLLLRRRSGAFLVRVAAWAEQWSEERGCRACFDPSMAGSVFAHASVRMQDLVGFHPL